MLRYILIKGLRFALCFMIVITIQFLIPRFMPGSPVNNIAGPNGVGLSLADYREMERKLGIDQPLFRQYLNHLQNTANLNLGYSWFYHQPVLNVVGRHIGATVTILFPAVVLSAFFALFFGSIAGSRTGKTADLVLTPFFLFLNAVPGFLTAMIALALLSFTWDIFPMSGLGPSLSDIKGTADALEALRHIILPVAVLALSTCGTKYLVMRNRVSEELHKDYVMYARARGMGENRILFIHVLRNACLPVISLIGLDLGFILSGSLLIEIVFSINGMGSLIYEAAVNRDYPVLQGCFFLLAVSVPAVNFAADLISGILDPGTWA